MNHPHQPSRRRPDLPSPGRIVEGGRRPVPLAELEPGDLFNDVPGGPVSRLLGHDGDRSWVQADIRVGSPFQERANQFYVIPVAEIGGRP